MRKDLTQEMRLEIAYQAYEAQQRNNSYGTITQIAKTYKICRAFVYVLLETFKRSIPLIFLPKEREKKISKKELISRMLLYRMVGKNSIDSISTIMRYDNLTYSSIGSISQSISAIGALLPNVQSIPIDEKIKITAVADEIFIGNQPILITAEPKSSVILSIELADDRTKDTWSKHLTKIESENNIDITSMATDEGTGLRAAMNNKGIFWQPDTYHAIAHRLGKWVSILEQRAYKRIAIEYERQRVTSSAKTKKIINQRRYKYNKAFKKTIEAIELYENFHYLYTYIIKQLQPFHSNGKIRNRDKAKANIEVALELMKSLEQEHINTLIKSIEKILPELLNYFEESKKAIDKCKKLGIDDDTITTLTLAWQWNKAFIKAKKVPRRKRAKEESLFYLEYAKNILGDNYEKTKELFFNELDNIVQASSIIENINSLLRPYLDLSKNQVTQEFLQLFAFYHNHRRYKAGKRKGKTPMEILTGKKQNKDWIEILTDYIETIEPDLFL